MLVMVVIGWPRGASGDFSWEESWPMHGKTCFSDERTAITSPGNMTRAHEVQGRARNLCFKTLCLSRVLLALAHINVALVIFVCKLSDLLECFSRSCILMSRS
ncbi:hypothetical protein JCGZ_22975 [Jatropha curcas]|uniref:Uncharacterized protein n=1 Tax=Jatropha curcas TaxID=180498 RepID=A0A067K268_JATCU|nr:hypothetical protein JCGZ_22975 [Jatropha curcas]